MKSLTKLILALMPLVLSMSVFGQDFLELDTYLKQLKLNESNGLEYAQNVKSQLFDIRSTVYITQGEINEYSSDAYKKENFTRLVTTASDLHRIEKSLNKFRPSLSGIETIIVKVQDAESLGYLEQNDFEFLNNMTGLQRVLFVLEFKIKRNELIRLKSIVPRLNNLGSRQGDTGLIYLYKVSMPS